MEEPTISQISTPASVVTDILGGDFIHSLIKNNVKKSAIYADTVVAGTNVNEADSCIADNTDACIAGTAGTRIAEVLGTRISEFAGTRIAGANAYAKFLVRPAGQGKVLCPSVR